MPAKILFITGFNEPDPEGMSDVFPTFFHEDGYLFKALQAYTAVDNMRMIAAESISAYSQVDFSVYDLIINRFVGKRLEDVDRETYALAEFFKSVHVPVINSIEGTLFSQDKMLCYEHFLSKGLRTPKTILADQSASYKDDPEFSGPLVVKPLVGWAAKNVSFNNSILEIDKGSDYIVQPQIDAPNCYRIICCHNETIAIYPKERNNLIHQGIDSKKSLRRSHPLYSPLSEMALKMIEDTPLFYTGADVLVEDNTLFALELNAVPGLPRPIDAKRLASRLLDI